MLIYNKEVGLQLGYWDWVKDVSSCFAQDPFLYIFFFIFLVLQLKPEETVFFFFF